MRCEEYYEKWRRTPNWCELTPGAVSQINSYLRIVDYAEEKGVPRSFTYKNLPAFAVSPVVSIKNPEIKDKVLDKIITSLKTKKSYKDTMKPGDPDCGRLSSDDVREIIHEVEQPDKHTPAPKVTQESYFIRWRISDSHGDDMSPWIKISYEEYEQLIVKYGWV